MCNTNSNIIGTHLHGLSSVPDSRLPPFKGRRGLIVFCEGKWKF